MFSKIFISHSWRIFPCVCFDLKCDCRFIFQDIGLLCFLYATLYVQWNNPSNNHHIKYFLTCFFINKINSSHFPGSIFLWYIISSPKMFFQFLLKKFTYYFYRFSNTPYFWCCRFSITYHVHSWNFFSSWASSSSSSMTGLGSSSSIRAPSSSSSISCSSAMYSSSGSSSASVSASGSSDRR